MKGAFSGRGDTRALVCMCTGAGTGMRVCVLDLSLF